MLKRAGTFLLIVALGFAAVQSASAQDVNDNHTVTIKVEDITELVVNGNATLTFDGANGASAVSETNLTDDNVFASASNSTTDYDIDTNRDGVTLEVTLTGGTEDFKGNGDLGDMGLAVQAETGDEEETRKLTALGTAGSFNGGVLDDSFGPRSGSGFTLTYEGVINEGFAENNGGEDLTVTYTVTE